MIYEITGILQYLIENSTIDQSTYFYADNNHMKDNIIGNNSQHTKHTIQMMKNILQQKEKNIKAPSQHFNTFPSSLAKFGIDRKFGSELSMSFPFINDNKKLHNIYSSQLIFESDYYFNFKHDPFLDKNLKSLKTKELLQVFKKSKDITHVPKLIEQWRHVNSKCPKKKKDTKGYVDNKKEQDNQLGKRKDPPKGNKPKPPKKKKQVTKKNQKPLPTASNRKK
jgi:hypothetical protein